MAWLLCDGRVVASLEMATTLWQRGIGLLGRNGIEGAMLLKPARSVHTVGMRFAIDVAHCDADMRVLRVATIRPGSFGRFVPLARCVVEAEAGSFQRWGVQRGSQLGIRQDVEGR